MAYGLTEFKEIIQKVDSDLNGLALSELKQIKNKLEHYSLTDFFHEALPNTNVGAQPAQLANNRQPDDFLRQAIDFPALNQGVITNNGTLAADRLSKVQVRLNVMISDKNKNRNQKYIDEINARMVIFGLDKKEDQETLLGKDWEKQYENKGKLDALNIKKEMMEKVDKKIQSGGGGGNGPTVDVNKKVKEFLATDEGKALLAGINLEEETKDTGAIGKKLKSLLDDKGFITSTDVKTSIEEYLKSDEGKKTTASAQADNTTKYVSWGALAVGSIALVAVVIGYFTKDNNGSKSEKEGE